MYSVKQPKNEEQELELILQELNTLFSTTIQSSSPLKRLYKDGLLTKEFILSEAQKITQKKSNLPSSCRLAIMLLIDQSFIRFKERQND